MYTCPTGTATIIQSDVCVPLNASQQFTLASVLGYTCSDTRYAPSGKACNLINGGVTTATSKPATVVYACPVGNGFIYGFSSSSNTCTPYTSSGQIDTSKPIIPAVAFGYSCPDTNYTLSGTTCLINATPSPIVEPATTMYTCPTGTATIIQSDVCVPLNASQQFTLASVLGYTCSDTRYAPSGKACNLINGGVTTATSKPATVVYACPVGNGFIYGLTSSNTCNGGANGTVLANVLGYVCTDSNYTLSGTTCNLNGGAPTAITMPATSVYKCPSTSYAIYSLSSSNTCNTTPTSLATVLGYTCPDNRYAPSGNTCNLIGGGISSATSTPATATYSCPNTAYIVYALSSNNTCSTLPTSLAIMKYACPAGYALSGTTCNLVPLHLPVSHLPMRPKARSGSLGATTERPV